MNWFLIFSDKLRAHECMTWAPQEGILRRVVFPSSHKWRGRENACMRDWYDVACARLVGKSRKCNKQSENKTCAIWARGRRRSAPSPSPTHFSHHFLPNNRPFPSSPGPLYQNEVRCSTFLVEMSFICMRMKIISISKVERLTSFWYRDPGELGNGLLHYWSQEPEKGFKRDVEFAQYSKKVDQSKVTESMLKSYRTSNLRNTVKIFIH